MVEHGSPLFTNLTEVGPSSNDSIITADTHTVLTRHYFCLSMGIVRISQRSIVLFSLSYCVCIMHGLASFVFVDDLPETKSNLPVLLNTGFPQLLKNHWNSDLFQDHGKVIEFHEKFLKFLKMKKSWKNHWILNQLLMEKSLNSEIDIVLTYYMGK